MHPKRRLWKTAPQQACATHPFRWAIPHWGVHFDHLVTLHLSVTLLSNGSPQRVRVWYAPDTVVCHSSPFVGPSPPLGRTLRQLFQPAWFTLLSKCPPQWGRLSNKWGGVAHALPDIDRPVESLASLVATKIARFCDHQGEYRFVYSHRANRSQLLNHFSCECHCGEQKKSRTFTPRMKCV